MSAFSLIPISSSCYFSALFYGAGKKLRRHWLCSSSM